MEDYIYRFRSLDRLLGKNGEPGELAKLEIFFARPNQLNDPLEGYKDIYWSGDLIAWRNLFKHYTTCLAQHVFLHLVATASDQPIGFEILIRNHCDALPAKMKELVGAAQDRALMHPEVTDYLEALSDFRKIRLQELTFHFNVLHRVTLHSVLSEFESKKLLPFMASEVVPNVRLDLITCRDTAYSIRQHPELAFDESVYEKAYGYTLAAKIEQMHDRRLESLFFLMAEFPEAFSKALEDLTHPVWYTACFMSDCTNSSVWGSYGENHTGICLVFNAPLSINGKPTVNLKIPVGEDKTGVIKEFSPIELHKVDYERKFAEIDFFNSLGSLPVPTLQKYWYTDTAGTRSLCGAGVGSHEWRQTYWDSVIAVNTTKLKDWQFEKEYRAILQPLFIDISGSEARKCEYEFNSLNGIIFGIKTPIHEKIRAIEIVRALCKRHQRSNFNFYQARYNPSENKISHHIVNIKISET